MQKWENLVAFQDFSPFTFAVGIYGDRICLLFPPQCKHVSPIWYKHFKTSSFLQITEVFSGRRFDFEKLWIGVCRGDGVCLCSFRVETQLWPATTTRKTYGFFRYWNLPVLFNYYSKPQDQNCFAVFLNSFEIPVFRNFKFHNFSTFNYIPNGDSRPKIYLQFGFVVSMYKIC